MESQKKDKESNRKKGENNNSDKIFALYGTPGLLGEDKTHAGLQSRGWCLRIQWRVAVSIIVVTQITWPESPEARLWKAERSCKSCLVHASYLPLVLVPCLASGMDVSFEIGREIEVAAWQPTYNVYFHPWWEMLGFSIFGWLIQLFILCAQENADCSMPACVEWLTPHPSAGRRNMPPEAKGPGVIKRPPQQCLPVRRGSVPEKLGVKWNETSFLINFHGTIGDEVHWEELTLKSLISIEMCATRKIQAVLCLLSQHCRLINWVQIIGEAFAPPLFLLFLCSSLPQIFLPPPLPSILSLSISLSVCVSRS